MDLRETIRKIAEWATRLSGFTPSRSCQASIKQVTRRAERIDRCSHNPDLTQEQRCSLVGWIVAPLAHDEVRRHVDGLHYVVCVLQGAARNYDLDFDPSYCLDSRWSPAQELLKAVAPDNPASARHRAEAIISAAMDPQPVGSILDDLPPAERDEICFDRLHDLTSVAGWNWNVGLITDDLDMMETGIHEAASDRPGWPIDIAGLLHPELVDRSSGPIARLLAADPSFNPAWLDDVDGVDELDDVDELDEMDQPSPPA